MLTDSGEIVATVPTGGETVFQVNPDITIKRGTTSRQDRYVVIDDFLARPLAAVDYAVQKAAQFSVPELSYPGHVLALASKQTRGLHRFIRSKMSKVFGFIRGDIELSCLFSVVSQSPESFNWRQRLPHLDPPAAPGRKNYAGVVYLFDQPELGGTAFYRWRDEGFLQYISDLETKNPRKAMHLLEQRYPMFGEKEKYMTDSNEVAQLLEVVPARFNRMLFYPGDIPHSAYITDAEQLTSQVADGRLTLVCFVSVRAY